MAEDRAHRTGAERGRDDWHRWWCWCAGLSLPGALLGIATWGLPAAVAIGVAPALLAGVVTAAVLSTPVTGGPAPRLVLRSATAAATVGTFATSTIALAYLAPPLGLVAVLVGAGTVPPVRGWLRRLRRPGGPVRLASPTRPGSPASPAPPASSPASPTGGPFDGPVSRLSAQQLCGVWRHSFLALGSARTASEVARLVDLRQAVLDELESRDAAALAAWLAAGAGAAEGPDRFLARDDDGRRGAA